MKKNFTCKAGFGSTITDIEVRDGYDYPDLREKVGDLAWKAFEESLELVQMANEPLDREAFLAGRMPRKRMANASSPETGYFFK